MGHSQGPIGDGLPAMQKSQAEHESPRTLVVDGADVCWTLEKVLLMAGYAVTTTTSGVAGAELIAKKRLQAQIPIYYLKCIL